MLTGQNYVRAGSCCIHLICTDNKWPSWQSNSSQSNNVFLIAQSPHFIPLVCIFLLYIWKQMTAFWLNIKIKNIYSDVNKSQTIWGPFPETVIPKRPPPFPFDFRQI